MVRIHLDQYLDAIAKSGSLTDAAYYLVDWAQRIGRLDDLLNGALAANPGNADLRAFARAVGRV